MVGSGRNRTSCRRGTASTAQRRHQPSLLALPGIGGELRVRTSVLADPSVFGTDCRPLQRRSPVAPAGREDWCISQDSNLDPVPYEGTALPIELEMRELALRREIESLSPRRQRGRLTRSVTEQVVFAHLLPRALRRAIFAAERKLEDQAGFEPATGMRQRIKNPRRSAATVTGPIGASCRERSCYLGHVAAALCH